MSIILEPESGCDSDVCCFGLMRYGLWIGKESSESGASEFCKHMDRVPAIMPPGLLYVRKVCLSKMRSFALEKCIQVPEHPVTHMRTRTRA